jgi:heterodisulfide reductase subunit A2
LSERTRISPMNHTRSKGTVLVVGAGIAGMQAALDLAGMNHQVVLIERSISIGGNMARLDKTFPTNDCSTCMIAPKMVAVARHPKIRIITLAELTGLEGEPGQFTARITRYPRYVDEAACISCRQCVEKCPKKLPNAYNAGLDERKAIYMLHGQSVPLVPYIDTESCIYFQKGRCKACEKICPVQAIRFADQPQDLQFEVGAVILAAGYELAVVPQAGEYGHGRYANVVTNLEYERMLSAGGPFGGHVQRPSDGKPPKRVAWIQCVASRDAARNRDFCSSVCCMAAVKQSILTREHDPEAQATIFYMDIRAQGKDFDRYVLRAQNQYSVRFVRSMLSQVIQHPETQDLLVQYYDHLTLEYRQEEFDLVVLSAGMKPHSHFQNLAGRLGLELNRFGFVLPDLEIVSSTSREGIFVCGALDGPKDIPESVTGASAAAATAASFLSLSNGAPIPGPASTSQESEEPIRPDEDRQTPTTAKTDPRVGVFVCHCGRNIAGVIDVQSVADDARGLPNVVWAEHFQFTCSTQTQETIKERIAEHGLTRVVVAACSPRTHEPLFRETVQQAGLNKYLFEMANIRDQCSWVHSQEPEAATAKAKELVRAAVRRAALLEPIEDVSTEVVPQALVIGGGLAGMTAALTLGDLGIQTALVEQEAHLGGNARRIHHTLEGSSPLRFAERLGRRVKTHRNIAVHTQTTVKDIKGGIGHFSTRLVRNGITTQLDVGGLIIATGGEPYRPVEYAYGESEQTMTQREFEERLHTQAEFAPKKVVMIQCVGSRNEEFPLCSRICCAAAVKNSIRLLERNPSASVFVLYRDIRTFGFKEEYYRKARELGAVFVKFEPDEPPEVIHEDGGMRVRVPDHASGTMLEIAPDALVLSTGIRPGPQTKTIARMLKLPLTQEGFFLEAHPKLSPLDFSSAGIYLCGLAHSPRFVEESLLQARGAAARCAAILLQKEIRTSGTVASVIRERCSSCLTCVYACPYNVPRMDREGISVIDPRGCQGCGICVAECPAKAITMAHYTDAQLEAQA